RPLDLSGRRRQGPLRGEAQRPQPGLRARVREDARAGGAQAVARPERPDRRLTLRLGPAAAKHEGDRAVRAQGSEPDVRVAGRPDPVKLVDEALPNLLDAPVVEEHLAKAVESDRDPTRLRARDEPP